MKRTQVIDALQSCSELEHILVQGWVRTKRISKKVSFLEVNDGSCLSNIQVIVDHGPETDPILDKLVTGARSVLKEVWSSRRVKNRNGKFRPKS